MFHLSDDFKIYTSKEDAINELNKITREPVRYQAETFQRAYKNIHGYFKRWGFSREDERTIL